MAKKVFPRKVKKTFGSRRAALQAVLFHMREKNRSRRAS